MAVISTDSYSLYGIACLRCNDDLIAPEVDILLSPVESSCRLGPNSC